MRPPKRVLTCRDFGIPKTKNKKIIFIVSDADRLSLLIGQASSFLLSCSFFIFEVSRPDFFHLDVITDSLMFSFLVCWHRGEAKGERERRPVEVLDYI
jgi:hypothetical protein